MGVVRIAVFVLLFVSSVSVFAQRSTRTVEPIIDVHLHAYSSDPRWNARTPNPVTGRPLTATNESAHMAETLAQLKKYHIVKAVLSGDYDAVQRWSAGAPNQFLSGCTLMSALLTGRDRARNSTNTCGGWLRRVSAIELCSDRIRWFGRMRSEWP
jgi:hypothetical protein